MSRAFGALPSDPIKSRMIILLCAAVMTAALALLLTTLWDGDRPLVAAAKEPPVRTISSGSINLWASSAAITRGARLDEVSWQTATWSRELAPEGAVLNRAALHGKFAARYIPANIPVTYPDISVEPINDTLVVTSGMRAITIRVNTEEGVEGWARPGRFVDVLLVFSKKGQPHTRILSQNARILSAGGAAYDPTTNSLSRRVEAVSTVTLEVSPTDAMIITGARSSGTLSLMMRGNDAYTVKREEVGPAEILGRDAQAAIKRSCDSTGNLRIAGKDYVLDCSGRIFPATE